MRKRMMSRVGRLLLVGAPSCKPRLVQLSVVLLSTLPVTASPAGLPADIDLAQESANVEITGAEPIDYSGMNLASGDFNGDGYVDLAILGPGAAPLGGSRRGVVDLIWGPFLDGTVLDLASAPGTRIFGTLIELDLINHISAGDLNADGFDDLIWGQPFGQSIFGDGRIYVLLGRPVFPDTMDLALGVPGLITVLGGSGTDLLGTSTCACDLDGDGYDELVAANPNPSAPVGQLVIIHGSDHLGTLYDLAQNYSDVTRVFEVADGVDVGSDLACGDLDGDSREDLVVSCGGTEGDIFDPNDDRQGLVRILFGHNAWGNTMQVTDPVFRTKTLLPPDSLDYFATLAAAAPIEGEVFIMNWGVSPLGCYRCGVVYETFNVSLLPDSALVDTESVLRSILIGVDEPEYTGWLAAGDFDDDEHSDLVWARHGGTDITFLRWGSASLPDTMFLGTDTTITRIYGRDPGGDLGVDMEVADFNDDGVDDLALGTWGNPSNGRTFIIFGDGTPTPVLVSRFTARSGPGGVSLAWSVSSLADVGGWHVDRSGGGAYVRLTSRALNPAERAYDDATARFDVTYTYRLIALTGEGERVAGIATTARAAPVLALYQNVPNPFNPMTTIRFSLAREGRAVLAVYAVNGAEVARLIDEKRPAGLNEVRWDGRDTAGRALASGVYFYRLQAGGRVLTRKLVLVR